VLGAAVALGKDYHRDLHCGGEPLCIFTSGLPRLEGPTVLEKRRYFREHYDHLRTGKAYKPVTASSDQWPSFLFFFLRLFFFFFFLDSSVI
jgi:hypothetical protein